MELTIGAASLLPSLCAIVLALVTRQVFVAMFVGVWMGAWLLEDGGLYSLLSSMFTTVDTYLLHAIVPKDGSHEHFSIVLFSLMTGAMIGVISRNGGMQGVVEYFMRIANTPRKAQLATYGLGGLIFFDDYANTLIVGNTMRPLTDRLKISRQKLAFLVDSTAAPIAAIAIVTTWVGFEVSLIEDSLVKLDTELSGFALVVAALPYGFYPLLMLWFILINIITGREFGAMLRAERQARSDVADTHPEQLHPETEFLEHHAKASAPHALIPILVYIGATIWGMLATGSGDSLRDVIGSADPFQAVLWGATAGLLCAVAFSIATRSLSMPQVMDAIEIGLRPMMLAMMILTFAWAIADVNTELRTAEYIVSLIGDQVAPLWLPALVFIVAALTSFATGSSWGTMGILVPLMVPLAHAVLGNAGIEAPLMHPVMLATIASVLTGAVFGDHCSPISDTTILSSMASCCNHIEHVRTQMPYAVVIGVISVLCGLMPVGFGIPWWVGMVAGMILLLAIIRLMGQPVDTTPTI